MQPLRNVLRAGALALALALPASAQEIALTASLDGAQEVPPVATAATGQAGFVIDTLANTLTYYVSFDNLSAAETAAHIHGPGGVGVPAGILFDLGVGNPKIGVWNYPQAQEANLLGGLTYVNIHSMNFTGGEIRGQIFVDTDPQNVFVAHMDGAQETPPVATTATGRGVLFIDTAADELAYYYEFQGLTTAQTAAHIHGPAPPGTPAGILLDIGVGSPRMGVWNYPGAQEANILAGLTYVNIHSMMFTGGEIRGQNLRLENPSSYCVSKANSLGCLPVVGSTGTPSLGGLDDFVVTASQELSNRNGLMFFGLAPFDLPFNGGTLCVQPPLQRTTIQNSFGNPPPVDCSGNYAFPFTHALMNQFGLAPGDPVYCQYWSRDPQHPDGTGVALTNGLVFAVQ